MPRSDKIVLTSCNIAAMEGVRKCDFRTTGLFSRSSFQIQIVFALSFWISHVLSDTPVSNYPAPLAQTSAPAPAPAARSDTPSPAQYIVPPETALAPPSAGNRTSSPPAPPLPLPPPPPPRGDISPPPPPIAISPASSPPLSETLTPPSPGVVQEAATNNSWNDSEKAGVIIASIGGLLQVFVVAYLLVKRHQMLAMVREYDTPEHIYKEIQPA